jgi:sugar phosphate isomerase/epimerase
MKIEQIGASAGYTFAYWSLDSTLERFLWSIERVGELGYKQYALEILEPPHVAIYSPENIKLLLDKSQKTGVSISSFIPYHCCTNLCSTSAERRDLGVKQFAEGVEIAKQLGTTLVSIASDWPPEWVTSYRAEYDHAPAAEFNVPSRQEFDRVWEDHVAAIDECLEIAERHKVHFGYEPRANCLVSNVDSFLRMWDELPSNSFLCLLDAMHCAYHRENLPVAIKKLGSRLQTLQVCGTDGQTLSHLPLTDDAATRNMVKALAEIGFQGILDVELYGMPSAEIDAAYQTAREILERQITALHS